MHLQRADRRNDDCAVRTQAAFAAFDVHEFFGAEIRAETGFGHNVVRQFQSALCGDNGVAAVSDIRKRTAVNQCGVVLDRLDKIRRECIL